MRKLKDKINLLVIMQSLSRQMFNIHAFNNGKKSQLNKRIKILKQMFIKNPDLKKQLKIRNLLQSMAVKDQLVRQRLVQSVIGVAKRIDNSKVKKQLVKQFGVKQSYWIRPNKIQQSIGNMLNNSKYYGMRFYQQQQSQVKDVLRQSLINKDNKIIKQEAKNIQVLCQNFNKKYKQLPSANRKLIKDFFQGNVLQQKKVLKQVTQLRKNLSKQGKDKLQYILQNTAKLDKFDKVFLLTSVLQGFKRCD